MKKNYIFLLFGLLWSTLSSGQLQVQDDTFAIVYGASDVIAGNVFLNDTFNGAPATLTNVNITQLSSTNPGISLSGTNVIVAAGTPRGTYYLEYRACEVGNSNMCSTGSVTINTKIVTDPKAYTAFCYNNYIGNVLGGNGSGFPADTLNNVPAILQTYYTQPGNVEHPADMVVTNLSNYPDIIINSNGDIFLLNPFPSQNGYLLTYQLCEIAHPTNCSIGYINVFVNPPYIFAGDDDFSSNPVDNTFGGMAGNVLNNDFSDCSGPLNANNATVMAQNIPSGLTLDFDGTIYVAVGTAPGTYVINYTVCETNLGICANATAYVAVTGLSALVANYDDFSAPNYPNTTIATSVLSNDTANGSPFSPLAIVLTPLNNPPGFSISANGIISIAATVAEGTYPIPYQICVASNPSDCYVNYAYVVVLKNRIIGKIKYDATANGCDIGDAYLNNISVRNVNGATTYSSNTRNYAAGEYYLIGDIGTNTVSVTGLPSYFTVTPATQTFSFSNPGTNIAPDFCVVSNSNVDDIEIVLIPLFNVVPGLPAFYNIWFKNNGSTTLSGQITFQFENTKMSFLTSSPTPNSTTSNSLVYDYTNIAPFESRLINNVKFQVNIPPTVDSGQVIPFTGSITPVAADYTPINNTCVVNQTVVNSQDPNDIIVHEGATLTLAKAQQEYLHYTIRFQNVGTSDAINIKVLNDLDSKLDWSTFKLISTSHDCRVKNTNNHNEFLFENIYLPGTENEPLSHGYISYKVKPIAAIAVGNVIPNTANIYFDFNAPIATNLTTTTIINNLGVENFAFNDFKYFPNPVKNTLTVSNTSTIDAIEITSVLGQTVFSKQINELQAEIDLSVLAKGVYLVKAKSQRQEKIFKISKE